MMSGTYCGCVDMEDVLMVRWGTRFDGLTQSSWESLLSLVLILWPLVQGVGRQRGTVGDRFMVLKTRNLGGCGQQCP